MTVRDLLCRNNVPYGNFPEVVDMVTVVLGLGILQSNMSFVEKSYPEWDYSKWTHQRRGFLDQRGLAYASAIAAWIRGQQHPRWARELRTDIRQPLRKSLRYLFKTNDSFFSSETADTRLLEQPQTKWIALAKEKSLSKQIIAIRHFANDSTLVDEKQDLLVEKLRSSDDYVIINAICAIEEAPFKSDAIVDELRLLVDYPNDEVRAKSIVALANLQKIDDATVDRVTNLLGSGVNFLEHATVFALSSQNTVPDYVLKPMSEGLLRALQCCDYDLVFHFTHAFNRWLDQPEQFFEKLLVEDGPEYLQVAMDSLQQVRNALVKLQ